MDLLPSEAEALFDQGYQHLTEKNFSRAVDCFRAAIQVVPEFLEAHLNLIWALEHVGALDEAETWYHRSLELDPTSLEIHLGLGKLLVNQKRFTEAKVVYDRVVPIYPDSPALWSNLGVLKVLIKQEEEAEKCFQKALELDGHYAKAQFNLSYLFLRQGRFEEGWRALQAREPFPYATPFSFPCWQGEDLTGRSLFIGVEKGHGDMIQFSRYAAVLKERGAARIGICCHPALERLFHTLEGVDQVVSLDTELPTTGWDFWTPPLSIPFHCNTRLDSIPDSIPYFHPRPEWVAAWRPHIPEDGLRVGLAWKGSPRFENDADRSLPDLSILAPLGAVREAHFISLQKGPGEDDAEHPPPELHLCNLGPLIHDFADIAGIMANLDLVISVDTSIAHLAGALGKRCWVLLPDHKTDWRWLTGRADSPWYPNVMRLFRQSDTQEWPSVIREVTAELRSWTRR